MWQFNYMIDLPFVLSSLHENVLPRVKMRFVYGDYSGEVTRELKAQAASFPEEIRGNATFSVAKLTDPFATHHTKMMVLVFKTGGVRTAQVVIHTANLIRRDWSSMCQGVWMSDRVGLKAQSAEKETPKASSDTKNDAKNDTVIDLTGDSIDDSDDSSVSDRNQPTPTFSFEADLTSYLQMYNLDTTKTLITYIAKFDWSRETAQIVGSVPGTHTDDKWGLARVAGLLKDHKHDYRGDYSDSSSDTIVLQASSLGQLGVTDRWLTPQLVKSLDGQSPRSKAGKNDIMPLPDHQIVWPTVDNIRKSFDGYDMGVSVHFKLEADTHRRQYQYLKSRMNVWRAESKNRTRAIPHIKTYARITKSGKLRWVLLTSANISKYAWGNVTDKGKFSIPSWELGVLLFPQSCGGGKPFFELQQSVVPYDWPLTRYGPQDEPWTKAQNHVQADVKGEKWIVK